MTSETPRVRTSDAERERVAETLRAAVGEGRLTLEEGDERLATLYTTKYRDELPPLVADLPGTDDARRAGRTRGRPADDVWTPGTAAADDDGSPRGPYPGYGQSWAGPGAPGWGPPRWQSAPRPWFFFPLVPVLLVFLLFGIVGGLAHGHFFVLIPLLFILFALGRICGFRRRWRGWRR
ncbi:MAG TPA: DUF1707 domain-containing protein [Micromonosporaceae bacterium]|nr:DUF1707 domain-containing protein [Micromonosporaceae bacterium]